MGPLTRGLWGTSPPPTPAWGCTILTISGFISTWVPAQWTYKVSFQKRLISPKRTYFTGKEGPRISPLTPPRCQYGTSTMGGMSLLLLCCSCWYRPFGDRFDNVTDKNQVLSEFSENSKKTPFFINLKKNFLKKQENLSQTAQAMMSNVPETRFRLQFLLCMWPEKFPENCHFFGFFCRFFHFFRGTPPKVKIVKNRFRLGPRDKNRGQL